MTEAASWDKTRQPNPPGDPAQLVAGDLPGLADAAERFAQLLARPAAPVKMPSPNELEVRLVSEQALERLFDAEKDATLHTNLLLLLVGAVLGFFTNILTAEHFDWSRSVLTYVILLALVAMLFGFLSWRSLRRSRHLRTKIGKSS